MKINLIVCILFLFVFAAPVRAAQKIRRALPVVVDASDVTEKPKMAVRIDEGRPVYIHSNKKFDCSGAVNHGGGCTRVVFFAEINGIKLTPAGTVSEIGLLIGLKNIEVEVSSELQKGSCLFDAVLKHELTHLALHRRILSRFAPEIAKAVLSVVETLSAPLTQLQLDKINKVLLGFVDRMMAEDKKQNELMDTQDAYIHLQNQCRKQ